LTSPGGTASPAPPGFLRRHAGLLAAVLLTLAFVFARDAANAPRLRKVDRHHLFGFDAYVYVAMAEDPAFFTVAPWGYRVLSPLLVHAGWPEDPVRGFRHLSLLGLLAAGPLLFAFLRAQGVPERWALASLPLFLLSPPVDEVYRNFFLAEPVALPLFLIALLAITGRAERRDPAATTLSATLAAALALGALTKDVFIVFLPGFLATAVTVHGLRQGLARVLPGGLAALAVHFGLRSYWAPFPAAPGPVPELSAFLTAARRILGAAPDWWAPLFLVGTPLALVGLLRPRGRALAARYGVLLLLALSLPFAAGIYTGTEFPADHFYTDDVPRLLMYALPLLFALALAAFPLGAAAAGTAPEPAPRPEDGPAFAWHGLATAAVLVLAAGAVAVPFTILDPYRREDLRGRTDGPFVLAFCRDSLAFARRLDAGRPVMYEPEARRYLPGRSDPVHMQRMRWFLRDGFGERPEYGMEEAWIEGAAATVLLPVLEPRDLALGLEVIAERESALRLAVNGRLVGDVVAGPVPKRQRLAVPGDGLYRGDNRLTLAGLGTGMRAHLRVLNVRAAGSSGERKAR